MLLLKKILMFGSLCLLASATFSHASTIFSLKSDACTGTCGPSGTVFATVTLTQTASGVSEWRTLCRYRCGQPFGLQSGWHLHDQRSVATGFSNSGSNKASAFGTFTNSINCGSPLCSNGGKKTNSAGPLSFLVEGAQISDFVANKDGYYFASDILGTNGKTGNVGTNVDPSPSPSPVPEPSSLILLGTGLVGMAGAFRRRISSAISRS